MHCPSCDYENREGASFCAECAVPLRGAVACPRCGTAGTAAQKFCDACGTSLAPAGGSARATGGAVPLPTSFADGRYEVRRFLGEGAKKRVYLAQDARLERDVALAVMKTDGLDEQAVARIRREARAMGRLGDHPNVVTVHDVGEEAGQTYIVSQYMSGGSVADLLTRTEKRRLPLDHVLRLGDQICRALEHAHARGVIHRDLKPENVWLTEDGTAKLGDFGLALALDRSRLTLEGMMIGTVAYMPPEQALGSAADARSDLYALGAMLYEMLAGRPPFLGDDAVAIISQHVNTPPVAPSWHSGDVPRALETLVLRLLAKAPEERPESAAAVREALGAIAAVRGGGGERTAPDDANPLDRLASGVFVGREREMDQLRAGIEDALGGRGRLVLLVGEPGIGKTRTAEEIVTYGRLRKLQVLWGRCYEGEGAPAYWPWIQAIRAYVHDRPPEALRSEMGSGASDIAQVVSEVRERLPGLPPAPTLEPEQARFRLFDSITTFLRNVSRTQPLILVVDDLHWADKPSLLLLQFLVRELRGARILVIGTYRDVDLRRQHPLVQTLAELTREQLAERIVLRGLGEHDVRRFVEVTAGIRPPEALVAAVFKETEGNPFFVNEIVRLLVADGHLEHPEAVKSWSVSIPQGVREVIGKRLDLLSPECNRVLTLAAVVGREFGSDALARLSGLAHERLLEVLEEAVAARVLVEVPRTVGRYSFTHALIRETLYEELTTTRRVRLHRQVGEVLEGLYGGQADPHLAELAYHFFEAAQGGDVDRAIAYAVRAGDRAAGLMAHEEAARHYDMALQGLDLRPDSDAGRCAMLLTLNESLWRAGEYGRAKEVALRAADIARRLGDAESFARAALGYGGRFVAFAAVMRDDTLVGLLEEALGRLGDGRDALRARLLGRLAEEIAFSASFERRDALCREAIVIARRCGEPAVLTSVLRQAHWALWLPDNHAERFGMAREIAELSEAAGDRAMSLEAQWLLLCDAIEVGDLPTAARFAEVSYRLAESLRQPYYLWIAACIRVLFAFAAGRLNDGEQLAQQALGMGQEAANENAPLVFGVHTMSLLLLRGEFEVLLEQIDGFAGIYPALLPVLRSARAFALVRLGRREEARREFDDLAADGFAGIPRTVAWFLSFAFLAEVCAALHDADAARARVLYALLLPFADQNVLIGPIVPYGAVSRQLGLLAATLGRHADAARHFEDALAMNARMGIRHIVAYTELDYVELLLAQDTRAGRPRALELVNRALDTARELGMKSDVERGLALKLRLQGVAPTSTSVSIDSVVSHVQRHRPDLRAHAAPDGTVTILFTDVEGSTALFEALGDAAAQSILRTHNRIVREQVAAHGGYEVKSQGDGFMVTFRSAARALRCAIAVQRAVARHAERHPDGAVRVRIGVHTGEVMREADDFFGRAVIQAARIAAHAAGGEILVSSILRQLAETGEFSFLAGTPVELKGLAGTHLVHPVLWREPDAA